MKSYYSKFPEWDNQLKTRIVNGQSVAIGVFNLQGEMLEGNPAMSFFMDANREEGITGNLFVNPNFAALSEMLDEGRIFKGMLTIGDSRQISYSLEAEIFRRDAYFLVFAEANTKHLFTENRKMSQLNQEVNNLQRQLMKEKMHLQRTLQELKETQQMLVHSEKMNAMGKLVAGVAHELNNPVAFVYSNMFSLDDYMKDIAAAFVEMEELMVKKDDSVLKDAFNELKERNDLDFLLSDLPDLTSQTKTGLERIKAIIEDLRKFSRLDEAEIKSVDLIDNLKSTIAIANLEFSKRDIKLNLRFPENLIIECYPSQLNQAFLNVFVNAAQAIEKQGFISISVSEKDNLVEITIEDDGCGIDTNVQSKIFDPFFTTKPVGSGTGLGLSITYKIITEMHKGTIVIESEEGKGTRVIIEIPKHVN